MFDRIDIFFRYFQCSMFAIGAKISSFSILVHARIAKEELQIRKFEIYSDILSQYAHFSGERKNRKRKRFSLLFLSTFRLRQEWRETRQTSSSSTAAFSVSIVFPRFGWDIHSLINPEFLRMNFKLQVCTWVMKFQKCEIMLTKDVKYFEISYLYSEIIFCWRKWHRRNSSQTTEVLPPPLSLSR